MLSQAIGYVLSHSQFLQHVTHRGWPETDQEHQRPVVSALEPRACALEELGVEPQKPTQLQENHSQVRRSGVFGWAQRKPY